MFIVEHKSHHPHLLLIITALFYKYSRFIVFMADYVKLDKNKDSEEKEKTSKFSFKKIALIILGLFVLSSIISSFSYSMSSKIAVIPIKGSIMSESSYSVLYGESISSREIANQIRSVANDPTHVGILLDINSGGGSAVATQEISNAIDYAQEQGIKVYAVAGDTAASGAFWIGTSADRFYASEMSLLGSIGVTMAGLSFEEFIEEYNISYRRLTAGEYKDIGSSYRAMTQEEEVMIQQLLDETHSIFISNVAKSRDLPYDLVSNWSQGQIFNGNTALEVGFIDEIGMYQDVLDDLGDGEDVLIVEYGQSETLLGSLGVDSPSLLPRSSMGLLLQ